MRDGGKVEVYVYCSNITALVRIQAVPVPSLSGSYLRGLHGLRSVFQLSPERVICVSHRSADTWVLEAASSWKPALLCNPTPAHARRRIFIVGMVALADATL